MFTSSLRVGGAIQTNDEFSGTPETVQHAVDRSLGHPEVCKLMDSPHRRHHGGARAQQRERMVAYQRHDGAEEGVVFPAGVLMAVLALWHPPNALFGAKLPQPALELSGAHANDSCDDDPGHIVVDHRNCREAQRRSVHGSNDSPQKPRARSAIAQSSRAPPAGPGQLRPPPPGRPSPRPQPPLRRMPRPRSC